MLGVGGSSRECADLVPTAKLVRKFSPCFNLDLILGLMFCVVGLREALFIMRSVCYFCRIKVYTL